MIKYCEKCDKEVRTRIVQKKEIYEVYGDQIEVDAKVLVCEECGEEIYCEDIDNETLTNAYNEYRIKHKLLFPDEIQRIREQYGLSQRSFSRLLNWGDKTIYRYENGSLQDKAHNSLLLFLRDPANMRFYLLENEVTLESRQQISLLKTIEEIERNGKMHSVNRLIDAFFSMPANEENGYKEFDYDKFCAMVIYFAQNTTELLKTKLMKLLHYSDMIFYKENGVSISGVCYSHLQFGPVPKNFEFLLGKMEIDKVVHIEVVNEKGYEKHKIIPDCTIPQGVLSVAELDVLNRVNEKFFSFGSYDISQYSHKEKGYSDTQDGEIISYSYAKYIQFE